MSAGYPAARRPARNPARTTRPRFLPPWSPVRTCRVSLWLVASLSHLECRLGPHELISLCGYLCFCSARSGATAMPPRFARRGRPRESTVSDSLNWDGVCSDSPGARALADVRPAGSIRSAGPLSNRIGPRVRAWSRKDTRPRHGGGGVGDASQTTFRCRARAICVPAADRWYESSALGLTAAGHVGRQRGDEAERTRTSGAGRRPATRCEPRAVASTRRPGARFGPAASRCGSPLAGLELRSDRHDFISFFAVFLVLFPCCSALSNGGATADRGAPASRERGVTASMKREIAGLHAWSGCRRRRLERYPNGRALSNRIETG